MRYIMAVKKRTRGGSVPLIIEDHPSGYNGYPFITLIQHRNEHVLTIIDNADDKAIRAFVLDLCGPEKVDENQIVRIASEWYYTRNQRYPLSFEFSRLGLSEQVSKIYRTYNVEFVTRVIGPLPRFAMNEVQSVRRRRKKALSPGVEIHKKIVRL
jgi:hypothetical protein